MGFELCSLGLMQKRTAVYTGPLFGFQVSLGEGKPQFSLGARKGLDPSYIVGGMRKRNIVFAFYRSVSARSAQHSLHVVLEGEGE